MKHPVLPALVLALAATAQAAQPWDQPFAADTRAILDRAKAVSLGENPAAIVLLEEERHLIRADGRSEATIRKVYRIALQDAVEDWASVEQGYQPWYQQEPEIRARVISASGAVQWLDPKTVASSPARETLSRPLSAASISSGHPDRSTRAAACTLVCPTPSSRAASAWEMARI